MRTSGFAATSFRDIAGDVGIKSASVHYHFPTKEDLGHAVADRYTERFIGSLGDPQDPGRTEAQRLALLVDRFHAAVKTDGLMCLCGMLGSEVGGLPTQVADGTRRFFERLIDWVQACLGGKSPADRRLRAMRIVALLEGAMIVARGLDDPDCFNDIAKGIAQGPVAHG